MLLYRLSINLTCLLCIRSVIMLRVIMQMQNVIMLMLNFMLSIFILNVDIYIQISYVYLPIRMWICRMPFYIMQLSWVLLCWELVSWLAVCWVSLCWVSMCCESWHLVVKRTFRVDCFSWKLLWPLVAQRERATHKLYNTLKIRF